MPNILDELSIKLSAQTSNVESALNDVARSIGSIVQELGNLKSVKVPVLVPAKTRDGLRDFADVISRLDMSRLGGFTNAMNELAGMSKLNLGISSKVTEGLFNFADVLKYMDINKLYMMGQAISSADFSNLKILGETARDLTKLYEQYNLLYQSQKKVAEAQSKVTINFSETRKEAHKTAATVHKTTGIFSKFFASIKRIAFYRVIRSAIREITQGLSEGIENLYYWSQAAGTSFAPAMDRMATATLYLKNGFASMWSPLIERAIPVLDALIDKWVDFFNIVQEGFARLTGQATWNKALKYPVTYKDALNDASKAAKEFKNQLLGFDELNVLNTPSNSGRGSGSDLLDYSRMFELVETNLASDGKGIGAKLADAVAGAFADPDKWGKAGDKAAGFLGTAFDNTIEFFQQGHENGMFSRMGQSMTNFFTKFATRIANKIKDTNWNEAIDSLTQALCDIIDGIDMDAVLASLAKLIVSITFSIPSMIFASLRAVAKLTSSYIKMWARAFGKDSFFGNLLMFSAQQIDKGADYLDKQANKWDKIGDKATEAVFNLIDYGTMNPDFGSRGAGYDPTTDNGRSFGSNGAVLGGSSKSNAFTIPITPIIEDPDPKMDTWWSGFTTDWSKHEGPLVKINLSPATTAISEWWGNFTSLWKSRPRIADVWTVIKTAWSAITEGWNELNGDWKTMGALPVSIVISNIWNAVQTGWNTLTSYWSSKGSLSTNVTTYHGNGTKFSAAGGFFAEGGYPVGGTLFWAGEGGVPEMLGTVNGHNAVAGGAEITGIREEIALQGQAERQMLAQLISAVVNKDLTLVANSNTGRWVNKALKAYSGVTG